MAADSDVANYLIDSACDSTEATVQNKVALIVQRVNRQYGTPGITPVIPGAKCALCEEEIELKRLQALPKTRICISCANKRES